MSPIGRSRGWPARPGGSGPFAAALLATALLTGCDDTLEPFQPSDDAIFSMVGYLNLKADTQWVRVMPVRRSLLPGAGAIDAVVTLEHVGTGRVVTLRDSLFAFRDETLGGVAYAHNFWTAERLEPEATYRLQATRSDGATSTAVVVMPPYPDILFVEDNRDRRRGTVLALFQVRAGRVLSVENIYDMGRYAGNPQTLMAANAAVESDYSIFPSQVPGMIGIEADLDTLLFRPGLVDVVRRQFRISVVGADWPYGAELTDLDIFLPGTAPSNVENGFGFVGGAASWTIPFDACEPRVPTPTGIGTCATEMTARTASIAGRVIRAPCGDPHTLVPVRLTEVAADGGVIRTWKTGWHGQYRFDGVTPNTDLILEVGSDTPAVPLPRLGPGEAYTVDDIVVTGAC